MDIWTLIVVVQLYKDLFKAVASFNITGWTVLHFHIKCERKNWGNIMNQIMIFFSISQERQVDLKRAATMHRVEMRRESSEYKEIRERRSVG